jgi:paraquat-inducible protein B
MSKQANLTMIGGFIVGAAALLVAGLVLFSSGSLFSAKMKYVVFFSSSVKGLSVGAPVDFRGARIGSVKDISVQFHEEKKEFFIPVVIEIESDRFNRIGKGSEIERSEEEGEALVQMLIDRGLRAQIKMESLVTGQLYIQLDFFPDSEPRYVGIENQYSEVPTKASSLEELSNTIKEIPFDELAEKIQRVLSGLEQLINSSDLHSSIKSANELMKETHQLVESLNKQVDSLGEEAAEVTDETRLALEKAAQAFDAVTDFVSEGSTLDYKLNNTLDEISAAARALKVFAGYLERHPEALLRGKDNNNGR